MLRYKRVADDGNVKRFEYYPNGDLSAPGIVEFETGKKPNLVKESPADVKMYFAVHALRGIDASKENGTVAWH